MINPLLFSAALVSVFAAIFIIAYALMKNKKEAIGFDRHMKDGEIVRRILPYAKPHIGGFLLVGLLMLFSIAYDIAGPLLIGDIEKLISDEFTLPALYLRVGVYASVLIVSLVSGYFQAIILQKIGQRIVSALRMDVFTHIESLSHGQLSKQPVGKLVTRVTNDTAHISMLFTGILTNMVKNVFVIAGVFIAMLALNYELTLMVLCFVPFILLFTIIFRKFSRRAFREVKDGTTDINTFLSENLSGIKVTQIFGKEAFKMGEFNERNVRLKKAKDREIFVFGIFRPLVYMLYILSVLCLFYLCGKGYLDGTSFLGQRIEAATLVSFYMYLSKFFNPLQTLAEQFNRLQSAMASGEKIFTIMDIEPDVVDEEDAIDVGTLRGEIEFRHVWFAYIPGEWVLKDVSFHINAGDTVAFVGATGSGKSTILSLLCRNYDIQQGEILVDGINIRHMQIASLRRQFGQMLQDVFLFSGTIRSNIVLREEDITDDEVMEACRYVNADKLIGKLENGLDEIVRERGSNFSAGERQLLSFARTIVHKPAIMILDEATANIDTETELLIQDSLEKMMKVGTMLMVAHRLSTIRHADKIIVIQDGEIIEEGTHEELLRQEGKYYLLYRLQYERQELGLHRAGHDHSRLHKR